MSETSLTPSSLYQALAVEMATAVAALLGESTATTRVAPPSETAWRVRLTASGQLSGAIAVGLTEADGRRISALIMGFEGDDVPDEAVVDTLREICAQAVGALSQAPDTAGVKLAIDGVSRSTEIVDAADAWQFPLPGGVTPAIAVGGGLVAGAIAAGAGPRGSRCAGSGPRTGDLHCGKQSGSAARHRVAVGGAVRPGRVDPALPHAAGARLGHRPASFGG